MNVANLELCKELYELSGWGDTYFWFAGGHLQRNQDPPRALLSDKTVAAYDLGYLLGKLQSYWPMAVYIGGGKQNEWSVSVNSKYHVTPQEADIPENAAAKLAIELFKQGILTKGDK